MILIKLKYALVGLLVIALLFVIATSFIFWIGDIVGISKFFQVFILVPVYALIMKRDLDWVESKGEKI